MLGVWEEPSPVDYLGLYSSLQPVLSLATPPQSPSHCARKNHPHAFSLDRLGPSGFSLPPLQDLNIVQRTTTMPSCWTSYVLPLSASQLFKNQPSLLCFLAKCFLFHATSCSRTATFTAWKEKASTTLTGMVGEDLPVLVS